MSEPVIPPKRGQKITEVQFGSSQEVPTQIMSEWMEQLSRLVEALQVETGSGSPEGVLIATENKLYRDTVGNVLYIKTTSTGDTGWVLV